MIKDKFVDLVKAKGFWIIFSLVLVVGLALRLLLINTPLWYDEACSWLAASKSFPSGINDFLLNHDFQHTPLYFYYLHFWMKFFGNSDISLRLSSLLPSLFILPLVYLTARQITSKFASLIVMFLVSVNVFQICYASEVRMYNLVILFALLSVFAMLRYIKDFKTSQLAEMVLYNVILSYLMIGSPVFIIAQIICLCSYLSQAGNKEQLRKVLISNGIFFILLIPYFLILEHYFLIRQDFLMVHSAELSFLSIIGILQKFLSQSLENGMYWVTINPYIIGTKEFFIFLIPLFVMLCAIYKAITKKDEKIRLLASVTIITLLIFILLAQFKVMVLSPRYLIYLSPILLILAGVGISEFSKKGAALFLAFYLFAGVFYLSKDNEITSYKRNSLFTPAQMIKSINMSPEDLVIMPFGSSVLSLYTGKNSPKILNFEAIQEFRQTENNNIYSTDQQQLFKMLNKTRIFKDIIIPDTNISKNFENYINSYIDKVPLNHSVLLIATGTDRNTLMENDRYQNYFRTVQHPEDDLMFAFMTEFFRTVNKLLAEKCELIGTQTDELHTYVLYKKVKN